MVLARGTHILHEGAGMEGKKTGVMRRYKKETERRNIRQIHNIQMQDMLNEDPEP
jgi:hypothetical protein